ncbi:hypothetical protein WOLCODRAFT_166100 [Wolfiporia cocos MD-104 SS10]|uniref:Uncharacterized protein n=1 Tax=Wolfiporia cocos (strain MD-104) TaxID=742152 RepID=A0A2H3IYW3_WOLCO|nr:hypothetical protein WOLCODRAFT_166100 [Wolfiporia cocos MD-104 SS10]
MTPILLSAKYDGHLEVKHLTRFAGPCTWAANTSGSASRVKPINSIPHRLQPREFTAIWGGSDIGIELAGKPKTVLVHDGSGQRRVPDKCHVFGYPGSREQETDAAPRLVEDTRTSIAERMYAFSRTFGPASKCRLDIRLPADMRHTELSRPATARGANTTIASHGNQDQVQGAIPNGESSFHPRPTTLLLIIDRC